MASTSQPSFVSIEEVEKTPITWDVTACGSGDRNRTTATVKATHSKADTLDWRNARLRGTENGGGCGLLPASEIWPPKP